MPLIQYKGLSLNLFTGMISDDENQRNRVMAKQRHATAFTNATDAADYLGKSRRSFP